ncbi:MAG: hypothetical protein ABL949_04695 [Fimbriimonadaceae bacterium]
MRTLPIVLFVLIAGCSSGGPTSAKALERPTDLPEGWTWHDIAGEKCGFAIPANWQVSELKEMENQELNIKGNLHDLARGIATSSANLLKTTGEHGLYARSEDPIAGVVVVSHRTEREPVDVAEAAGKAASAIASAPMKSDVPPTSAKVTLPAGEGRVVIGEFSGASTGQPELKLPIHRYIWAFGNERFDVLVIGASVGGSELPDAEQIAKTFRFSRT